MINFEKLFLLKQGFVFLGNDSLEITPLNYENKNRRVKTRSSFSIGEPHVVKRRRSFHDRAENFDAEILKVSRRRQKIAFDEKETKETNVTIELGKFSTSLLHQ